MKRIACRFTYTTAFAVAAAFFTFMALSSPGPSRAAPPKKPSMATAGKVSKGERIESRIKQLHARLEITPAQEELWNKVAQVMRDNAKTMEALIKTRSKEAATMTAIDTLKYYAVIVQTHADGIRKFITPFDALYASMSNAQKKNADALFRHHGRMHHGRMKPKAKGK